MKADEAFPSLDNQDGVEDGEYSDNEVPQGEIGSD